MPQMMLMCRKRSQIIFFGWPAWLYSKHRRDSLLLRSSHKSVSANAAG